MEQDGRRIPYEITEKGNQLFQEEVDRLRICLADTQRDYQPAQEADEEVRAKAGAAGKPAFA